MAKKSDFWDERYSVSEYVYGEHPNNYLKKQLETLPVGSILFVGEGEGRNGVLNLMFERKYLFFMM